MSLAPSCVSSCVNSPFSVCPAAPSADLPELQLPPAELTETQIPIVSDILDMNQELMSHFGDTANELPAVHDSAAIDLNNEHMAEPVMIDGGNVSDSDGSGNEHSAHDDGFDDSLAARSESAHSSKPMIVDPGWTHEQKSNLFEAINAEVFRYERSMVRGVLPWETGIMKAVFRTGSIADFIQKPMASVPMPLSTSSSVNRPRQNTLVPPTIGFAVRRLRNVRLLPSDDALRTRAMIKWRLLIELDLEASHLGSTVKSLAESMVNESKLMQTISDTFASKSTATLFKRAQSIFHYHNWAVSARIDRPLLFSEQAIYDYVCYLREQKSSATKAEAFKQAVAFATHVLGMPAHTCSFSNRFLGACRLQFLNKRPLQQAPPLTIEQVKKLERLTIAAPLVEDRVVAGQFLFCLYSSCRFSDSMYIKQFKVTSATNTNGGNVIILDAGTLKHKTATTRERATSFLPLLATGIGVSGLDWANPWIEARQKVGLFCESEPFLPAFLINGQISSRRMTTGEASAILKDMLADVTPENSQLPTTHSLKATILSWLSKDGAPFELRRIAGHHMDPASRSVLTYSRDALLSVLVRVNKILAKIRDGTFDPDANRAEFVLNQLEAGSTSHKPNLSESESEDDVAEIPDALNEASDLWKHVHPDNKPPAIVDLPVAQLVQHATSGIVHIVQNDLDVPLNFLRCGRPVTDRFALAVKGDPVEWPICKVCEANWRSSQP